MAGTVTVTAVSNSGGTVRKVSFAWNASTSGEANSTQTITLDGDLIGFATVPGASTSAPTDNYDITLVESRNSLDVLLGQGANRDTANTEYVAGSSLGAVAQEGLTLNVTNAGDNNTGTAVVWIR